MKTDIIKWATASISGIAATFWGVYGPVFICVLVAVCLDIVTGLIKSKATGVPITSEKGALGFWRKMALLAALAFGIFLDAFIPIMLGAVSVTLPFALPIGTVVGCYIVLNESISIFENINKTAPQALPKWIKKLLDGAKKTVNDGGGENGQEDNNR